MKIRFTIPVTAISNNVFYAGMHWAKRNKIVDTWHNLVRMCCPHITPTNLQFPVTLTVIAYCKGRLLDCSNVSATAKLIEDGLKGTILPDDTPEYVSKVILMSRKAKEDSVEVIIEERNKKK